LPVRTAQFHCIGIAAFPLPPRQRHRLHHRVCVCVKRACVQLHRLAGGTNYTLTLSLHYLSLTLTPFQASAWCSSPIRVARAASSVAPVSSAPAGGIAYPVPRLLSRREATLKQCCDTTTKRTFTSLDSSYLPLPQSTSAASTLTYIATYQSPQSHKALPNPA
jgi:hypothetical protein